MVIMRIHRDTFPRTDHGFTWAECIWFERDGVRVSPLIPASGCCERLGHMPGGPVVCDIGAEQRHYAPEGVARIEKSESLHDQAFYQVGTVCIVPASERQEDRPVNQSNQSLKEVQP